MSNQKKTSTKKSSTSKASSGGTGGSGGGGKKGSPLGGLLGAVVVVIAAIIFLVTGVDLTGGALSNQQTPSVIVATATPRPATTLPATNAPATSVSNATSAPSGNVQTISNLTNGFGASKGWWQVYFVKPLPSTDTSLMVNGISVPLVAAINQVRRTLDIAAFEFNEPTLEKAILDAHARGVQVRIVTDDEHGAEDLEGSIPKFIKAGIAVIDDGRSALMHNKIMIMDGLTVWTGATNFTRNGMYRNNNNLVAIRSRRAVELYQAEFNEMFVDKLFGPRSTKGNSGAFVQDGTEIEVWFASEDDTITAINEKLKTARNSIHFMTFSFTQVDVGNLMLDLGKAGIKLEGVFERTGSETKDSEMTLLFCAGFDVRQDTNPSTMHHKVIIIDEETVITGSFNFSQNAMQSNDENLLIIKDRDFARQYMDEFNRVYGAGRKPTGLTC